jgi:hypothetical protein
VRGLGEQLDDQPLSPTVLRAREILDGSVELGIRFRRQNSGRDWEAHILNTQCSFRICSQIFDPLRGGVLGNHVQAAVVARKPDFNFAGHARFTAAGGQVQVLLALETTGL